MMSMLSVILKDENDEHTIAAEEENDEHTIATEDENEEHTLKAIAKHVIDIDPPEQ